MKKQMILAAMGVMLTATAAQAEHKLLITDVLEPKQVEAQALYEYSRLSGSVSNPVEGAGKLKSYASESNYSVGVGLLHGLELTASIPYVFSERATVRFDSGAADAEKRDGFGDFALEAKYRLLGGEKDPFTVVAGLGVKFDTAGDSDAGTGTTNLSPFVAASTNLGHHYIPYAVYRATLRNHEVQDTHTLSLGLEKEINHAFTVDAKFDANFNTASRDLTANEDFAFEVTGYIQLAHNFYLLPSAAYLVSTDATIKAADTQVKSLDGFRAGASLYYLF